MDENVIGGKSIRFGDIANGFEVINVRMHPAIGNQPAQVQPPFPGARVLHRLEQYRMLKQLPVLDHQVDAGDVHVNNAPRADVEVPNFAVAHLPFRQSDVRSTGVNECVGIFPQQPVVGWLACESNGVGLGFGPIPPAVENDQYEWFRTRHDQLLAPGDWTIQCFDSHLGEVPDPRL